MLSFGITKNNASVNNLVQMSFCTSMRNSVAKFLSSGVAGLKGQLRFSIVISINTASLHLDRLYKIIFPLAEKENSQASASVQGARYVFQETHRDVFLRKHLSQ